MTTLRGAPAMLALTAMAVIILVAGFIIGEIRKPGRIRPDRRAEREFAASIEEHVASLTPDEIEQILTDSDWRFW